MASMNENPIVERFLNESNAILTMVEGKYIIMTQEEDYEYDTYEEMLADIEATVTEWDKIDSQQAEKKHVRVKAPKVGVRANIRPTVTVFQRKGGNLYFGRGFSCRVICYFYRVETSRIKGKVKTRRLLYGKTTGKAV